MNYQVTTVVFLIFTIVVNVEVNIYFACDFRLSFIFYGDMATPHDSPHATPHIYIKNLEKRTREVSIEKLLNDNGSDCNMET